MQQPLPTAWLLASAADLIKRGLSVRVTRQITD